MVQRPARSSSLVAILPILSFSLCVAFGCHAPVGDGHADGGAETREAPGERWGDEGETGVTDDGSAESGEWPDDGGDDAGPADGDGGDVGDAGEADAPRVMRVLFVGNSYTYVNDLPAIVAALAADGTMRVAAESATAGGATLADHLSSTGAVDAIRRGGWDVVVLQGQSVEPLYDLDGFLAASAGLAAEIRGAGAETLFFETWARRAGSDVYAESWSGGTPAAMQAGLRAAYRAAADAASGRSAPVGDAWEASLSAQPGLALHADDGSHPSLAGSYLAACVFLGVLTGRDPRTAAGDVVAGLAPGDAASLRVVAARTLGF